MNHGCHSNIPKQEKKYLKKKKRERRDKTNSVCLILKIKKKNFGGLQIGQTCA